MVLGNKLLIKQIKKLRTKRQRRINELINQHNDLTNERNDLMHERDGLMHERDGLMHERNGLIRERDAGILMNEADREDSIPGILFNTLPKSASVYILEIISKSLQKTVTTISPGYFPIDLVDFRRFQLLIEQKGIAQSHLDASTMNLKYIKRIEKVIIHFRDPRQATLSWLHHLERLNHEGEKEMLFAVNPNLPKEYFGLTFKEKIDYQLKMYFPRIVEWMINWIDFLDKSNDSERFYLSTYEEFKKDSHVFFRAIFDFLGCPDIEIIQVKPTTKKNFRKGLIDEWESVFSQSQISTIESMIPKRLMDRFNW